MSIVLHLALSMSARCQALRRNGDPFRGGVNFDEPRREKIGGVWAAPAFGRKKTRPWTKGAWLRLAQGAKFGFVWGIHGLVA